MPELGPDNFFWLFRKTKIGVSSEPRGRQDGFPETKAGSVFRHTSNSLKKEPEFGRRLPTVIPSPIRP
jgi:hypothetical protein